MMLVIFRRVFIKVQSRKRLLAEFPLESQSDSLPNSRVTGNDNSYSSRNEITNSTRRNDFKCDVPLSSFHSGSKCATLYIKLPSFRKK